MDWVRLQKALSVEADRGFNDLVGKQQRFSEFLSDSLHQPPSTLPSADQQRWRTLSEEFGRYDNLTFAQRQHLVADARRFLYQTRRILEQLQEANQDANSNQSASAHAEANQLALTAATASSTSQFTKTQSTKAKSAKTKSLVETSWCSGQKMPTLDQP